MWPERWRWGVLRFLSCLFLSLGSFTIRDSFTRMQLGASQVAEVVKNPPASAGGIRDVSWIPGSGRSPGGGNGNPLQYSYLGNPLDRGVWWATVHGVTKRHT